MISVIRVLDAEPHMEQIEETVWSVIGNVGLREIENVLKVDFEQTDVDTFTRFVFSQLDMVPHDGEQNIQLEFKNLHIQILRLEEHQIAYAVITKNMESEQEKV